MGRATQAVGQRRVSVSQFTDGLPPTNAQKGVAR